MIESGIGNYKLRCPCHPTPLEQAMVTRDDEGLFDGGLSSYRFDGEDGGLQ